MKSKAIGLHLVIRHPDGSRSIYELTSQITRIGRDATNDIILDYTAISRKHARLIISHDSDVRFLLEDLNSSNGTFINHQPVEGVAALRIGDTITIASEVTLTFQDGVFERDDERGTTRPFETGVSVRRATTYAASSDHDDTLFTRDAPDLMLPQLEDDAQDIPTVILQRHIFLSHADGDNLVADRLATGLDALDIPVWVDHRHLRPSDHWENKIQKALQESWAGLLVLSREALQSVQCSGERQYFLRQYQRKEKELFVVLLEPFKLDELPYNMSVVQFIDLSSDFRGGIHKLLTAIQEKVPEHLSSRTLRQPVVRQNQPSPSSGSRSPHQPPKSVSESAGSASTDDTVSPGRVFISHSYDELDLQSVEEIYTSLKNARLEVACYVDEPGSVNWRIEVAEAIEQADCVVAIISPETKNSEWLQHELTYAQVHQKPLFAIHIRGDNQSLFGYNMRFQVSAQASYEVAIQRLIHAIRKHFKS